MNRREFLSTAAAMTTVLIPGLALADSPVDKVIRQLRKQGFNGIESTRTLLGRARVVAERGEYRREIVLNPGSGEILRDIWLDADGNAIARVLIGDDKDEDQSSDDPDDPDDDSDDPDNDSGDDSDNSGHGSGNSGSGSDDGESDD